LHNIEIGEGEKFSGEISRYHEFRVRYNGLMKNVSDAQTKLDYLLKWTKGKAHRAIAKCVYNDNYEAAMEEALQTLEERFGTPFKIADQKVEEIVSGKK
jgi:chemotaxis regulatin CheY-phosphate phosphatase CheZ